MSDDRMRRGPDVNESTPRDQAPGAESTAQAIWLSVFLGLAAGGLSLFFWPQIPDPMPIHWDVNGDPDGFASKLVGVTLMPALTVLLPLFIYALTRLDPRRERVDRSRHALGVMMGSVSAFMFAMHGLIIRAVMQPEQRLDSHMVFILIGALFILIGNAMPKFGSNFFVGVRTPWALSSEKVWIKTQRLGGKLFMLGGLVACLLGLVSWPMSWVLPVFMAMVALITIVPVVYSWLLWREERRAV